MYCPDFLLFEIGFLLQVTFLLNGLDFNMFKMDDIVVFSLPHSGVIILMPERSTEEHHYVIHLSHQTKKI